MGMSSNGGAPVRALVGVGFGPSNLSLAIAVHEHNQRAPHPASVSATFLEKQPRFGWHRDMLIDGSTVQVSFLKDLVTMRDPSSEFSFLAYLQDRGRLAEFINHKTLFPSRVEFHDYLDWAAGRVSHLATYDCEVTAINPVSENGVVSTLDVLGRTGTGQPRSWRARNVVIAAGLQPKLPAGVVQSDRVWHSDTLLSRLAARPDWSPRRLVVVGAGQSAAEIVEFLHRRYESAEVCAVFSRYGYSPSDDSPFVNRVFDPAAVDVFYRAPEKTKQMILDYHANTNYSVVDLPLIDELYRRCYQERVVGQARLRIINLSRVVATVPTAHGVHAVVESLAGADNLVLDADAVVFATGYRPTDPLDLLGDLKDRCRFDAEGRPRVRRNYQLETTAEVTCGIYVQGSTQHTHGISSGLLSNVAVRAGEVLRSITEHTAGSRPSAPMDEPAGAVP